MPRVKQIFIGLLLMGGMIYGLFGFATSLVSSYNQSLPGSSNIYLIQAECEKVNETTYGMYQTLEKTVHSINPVEWGLGILKIAIDLGMFFFQVISLVATIIGLAIPISGGLIPAWISGIVIGGAAIFVIWGIIKIISKVEP
jgi:hypothetical protein